MTSPTFYEGPGSSDGEFDPDPLLDGGGEDDLAPGMPVGLAVSDGGGAENLLEDLRRELGRKTTPTYPVPVPDHPTLELVVRLDWDEARSKGWRKRAQDRTSPEGISLEKLAVNLLIDQTVHILYKGTMLKDGPLPWTFKSASLWEFLGVRSAPQAVKHLIPRYTHLAGIAQDVARAAGQPSLTGYEDDELDPTGP